MALLAEELVEEWLNRQGFFSIRGIRLGVHEIDILAVKLIDDDVICRHIEVQASVRPVSYICPLSKAHQESTGRKPMSAKERTQDELQASVIGGSLVHVDEQAWWGPCHTPLADQYVLLPGGQGAKLIIINPEPDEALIDVTLSGPAGEITGDGLRGITIPANSQHEIDLGPLAGSLDAVGARVRSSVGRVLAVAQVSRDKGGDFATSTVQSTRLMVAAIPAGASKATLLLTNPGTSRNVVRIEALGEGGRFDLPGFESYAVDAQRTIAIDLTAAIEGAHLARVITARD